MKAILVIDTTKCDGCPFCHKNAYYSWCNAPRKERFWEMPLTSKDIEEERIVDCPLKALPKPITEYEVKVSYDYDSDYAQGWNDCLKEITGETE